MGCEQFRVDLMALADGELPDSKRGDIERHIHDCPACNNELRSFQRLSTLTGAMHFQSVRSCEMQLYWAGVCRKMHAHASWRFWAGGSLALVATGNLMIFGFTATPLATMLGGVALVAGFCVLGLSYYCNCKQ